MSVHSYPSLISDSSSLSPSSDIGHDQAHERLPKPFSTLRSTLPTDLDDSKAIQLRPKVSRLEKQKFILGDYAAELQSRIRNLERQPMQRQDLKEDIRLAVQTPSNCSNLVSASPRSPSPTNHARSIIQSHPSLHRPSSSLSAATSYTTKCALAHTPPLSPPSSTSISDTPPTFRDKLTPKHKTCVDDLKAVSQSGSSLSPVDQSYDSTTPTRRRLHAMYGIFSSDSSSQQTSRGGNQLQASDSKHSRSLSIRAPESKRPSQEAVPGHGPKRTALTSKLDSIILTSKLFPLPSSRSKPPLSPVSPDHRPTTSHTTLIPLARPISPSSNHGGAVCLDSPPSKSVRAQLSQQGNSTLSKSLGLEENRYPEDLMKCTDRKAGKSRGRVSFSDRLFSSPSERGDELGTDGGDTARRWGSWNKKKSLPPLIFSKEKYITERPSDPPSAFPSRFTKSNGQSDGNSEDRRKARRATLTPACLRTLVLGANDRNESRPDGQRVPAVLRRSRSDSRRSGSRSRSRGPTHPEDGGADATMRNDKEERNRITISRVGSPKPKTPLPELQGGGMELERVSSMRSAGKYGQRGKGFAPEVSWRRTVHPMFSFERPGSTEAASMSSSRRDGEKPCDEDLGNDGHPSLKKTSISQRPVASTIPGPARPTLAISEFGVGHSQGNHTLDHSYTSAHTGGSGTTRSEPGSARKGQMMHMRFGMQSHGTFAFEPATAVICAPRSAPLVGSEGSIWRSGRSGEGSLSRSATGRPTRSLSVSNTHRKTRSDLGKMKEGSTAQETREREYSEFCDDLRDAIGDEEDWSSFTKYVRRFELEVLTAEVLLQRVKKIIDGHRSVDGATRIRLYERFAKIVHDNLHD